MSQEECTIFVIPFKLISTKYYTSCFPSRKTNRLHHKHNFFLCFLTNQNHTHIYFIICYLKTLNKVNYCPNQRDIFLAIIFSFAVRFIGYLTSFPSFVRYTTPSKTGLFLASMYILKLVYKVLKNY